MSADIYKGLLIKANAAEEFSQALMTQADRIRDLADDCEREADDWMGRAIKYREYAENNYGDMEPDR